MDSKLTTTAKEGAMDHDRLRFVLTTALALVIAWAFVAEVMFARRVQLLINAPVWEEASDASR